jgi:N-acetyl-anhydromuramyl-L-alanine amidase AmpD
MAWIVRTKKNGKWTRVRTILNPRGVFLTRADADKVAAKVESQGKMAHVHAASMPVPRPRIDTVVLSPSQGENERRVIVLHSTESHDREGVSDVEGILNYLRDQGLGVHYCVDGEGYLGQGAEHHHLVYHCKGANSFSIGIEQVGFAAWKTRRWLWDPTEHGKVARKQLVKVAELIAYIADSEGIPIKRSTTHGVACHKDFPAGGHWDPGPGYPLGYVLRRARKIRRQYRSNGGG